jgi:hypothetical protein
MMELLKKQIDLKHHAELKLPEGSDPAVAEKLRATLHGFRAHIEIVKTGNGQAIPQDEPTMLFRGRDHLAVALLVHYQELCRLDGCNDFQLGQVAELINRFHRFAAENPKSMKQPGVTRGL